jgi:nucleotide-binding universal stress UspA family protein
MLKDIALAVDVGTKAAGSYAVSLAKLMGAHLTIVPADIESALAAYASSQVRYDVILGRREERRAAISTIVDELQKKSDAQGLPVSTLQLDHWAEERLDSLVRIFRTFDLIVVEQVGESQIDGRSWTIAASVLKTGRPALIVPYIRSHPASLETVLLAWDGSAQAARALGDALPLLAQAGRVVIVGVDADPSEPDGAALEQHLARHGINASFKRTSSAGDIGNTLLSYAADLGADLMVMGAYGHSRLREDIFGGTTNTILESMTIPVLMSR